MFGSAGNQEGLLIREMGLLVGFRGLFQHPIEKCAPRSQSDKSAALPFSFRDGAFMVQAIAGTLN